jgi:hypothetical protein
MAAAWARQTGLCRAIGLTTMQGEDLVEIIDMSLTAIMFVNRSGARGEIV